jgi:hypothetical protein
VAVALVQTKSGQVNNTGDSITVTPTAPITAGNLIVVSIAYYRSTNPPNLTISDAGSNSYTLIDSQATYYTGYVLMYYAKNCNAAANVTATEANGNAYITLAVHEYSGAHLTTPLDQTAKAAGGSNNTPATGNVTTAETEMWVGAETNDYGDTAVTPTSPYTLREYQGAGQDLATMDALRAAVTSNVSMTLANATYWAVVLATFKAAPVAGTKIPLFMAGYRRRRA